MSHGPQVPYCDSQHASKYRGPGESFEEAMNRIASELAPGDEYKPFREILLEQRFMPGGRIQSAVGSERNVTPYNCLDAGTKFITREYGVIDLGTASEYERVTLLDGNGRWFGAKINEFGIRDVRCVRLTSGNQSRKVWATDDHRWILADGSETTTRGLRRGKKVAYLHAPDPVTDSTDYRDGVAHGIVYGDGSLQQGGRFQIRLCGAKAALLRYLPAMSVTHPESAGGDPFVVVESDRLLKNLPSKPSPEYIRGFMRGWMATDGCVSTQPEVTICMSPDEVRWCRKWAPVAGWHPLGWSKLAEKTNFGTRNKESGNLRFDRATLSSDDFLMDHHRERFVPRRASWRVAEVGKNTRKGVTYCPRVLSTDSFVLEGGIHTGQCFVAGTIADSLREGDGSITKRLDEALGTLQMGGGIGYDFSTLRPRGAEIRKLRTNSAGPLPFMGIFDAACRCISAAGHRRGAQMGVLRVDHPDIEEFIHAKQEKGKLEAFNISIAVTDEFMEAVRDNKTFWLRFGGQNIREVNARALWDKIMRSTWDWAEPGVLFIDRINGDNNLWYCEQIAATNPCGEQPLPPHGACLLGSFNLVKYLSLGGEQYDFDFDQFARDVPRVVRAMDRVVDVATYPLFEQEQEAKNKRRMGLGVTGVANAIERLGFRYGSKGFIATMRQILRVLRDEAYRASVQLAKEKGPFPLYDVRYRAGEFIQTLPQDIRAGIAEHGIRNSHLLSIAPTGTISLCADNISSGIEPVFAYDIDRTVIGADLEPVQVHLQDYGVKFLGVAGKVTSDVTADEHLDVLAAAQKLVDSAVSKTINMDGSMPWEDFKRIYFRAWELGCKGCTTYNKDGKRNAVLREAVESGSCRIDTETGRRECE